MQVTFFGYRVLAEGFVLAFLTFSDENVDLSFFAWFNSIARQLYIFHEEPHSFFQSRPIKKSNGALDYD